MTDPVALVRSPVDIPPAWHAPAPKVNADEHMALGTSDAIAKDADRGIAAEEVALPPAEEFSTEASSNGYLGVLQGAGIPREVISGASKWLMHGVPGKSDSELAAQDATDLAQARVEMQQLWGDKYLSNAEALTRYIDGLPKNQAEIFLSARDPATGRAYLNDPANIVRLMGLARAPQPTSNGPMTIEAIEAFMKSNRAAYTRDESLQARYRELLDKREQGIA